MLDKYIKIVKKEIKEFSENALDTIFPLNEICMYCDKRVLTYKHYLCKDCYESLEEIDYKYLISVSSNLKPIEMLSSYVLDEASGRAVYDYKLNRKRGLAFSFSSMLIERLSNTFDMNLIDAVVPIPSTKKKNDYRGFDHISDITKKISKHFEIPHIFLLERLHHNADQKELNREQRLQNVQEAFKINKRLKKKINLPISVLLVDDIITTGATIESAMYELEKTGIKVYGVSVFRKL